MGWSMENLTEQLRQKFLLVEQLKNEIYSIEHIVRSRMNQGIEQIRASHQHQIKQLQDNLEMLYHISRTSKGLITQCDNLIEKL
jgi:ABC-type phosphate transport system auxiliary subunit